LLLLLLTLFTHSSSLFTPSIILGVTGVSMQPARCSLEVKQTASSAAVQQQSAALKLQVASGVCKILLHVAQYSCYFCANNVITSHNVKDSGQSRPVDAISDRQLTHSLIRAPINRPFWAFFSFLTG
jgi:hypothetical protein